MVKKGRWSRESRERTAEEGNAYPGDVLRRLFAYGLGMAMPHLPPQMAQRGSLLTFTSKNRISR